MGEAQLAKIDDGAGRHWRLRKLALALIVFIPTVGHPMYEFYFGDVPQAVLNEQDRRRIDELIRILRAVPEVEERKRRFFRTLERDPSISGAGVSEGRTDPPAIIVSSTEFAERSGLWSIQEDEQERTRYLVLDVVLIAPRLISAPRTWTFQPDGLPEFTAIMRDKRFLAALAKRHVQETLRTGIKMTIRLEVKERKVRGAWIVRRKGRSVIQVISPRVD